jgi:hypothetical protein
VGAFARCWICDRGYRSWSWNDDVFCSRECAKQWRRAPTSYGRVCVVCRKYLDPAKRTDAAFCSERCKRRSYRRAAAHKRFELVKELVSDDLREQKEAWRRLRRANPENYARTPMAARLRRERLEVLRWLEGKAVRQCEQCGAPKLMRRGQRYCSGRCRVAAHRLKSRATRSR